jgi:hypothetical protein
MKKKHFLLLAAAAVAGSIHSQTCLKMKQGQTYRVTGNRYENDEVFQPSYGQMKESKRDKKVAEFNDKVFSGEIKPKGATYAYLVKTLDAQPGAERAVLAGDIGGVTYESIVSCIRDTMYFTRLIGLQYMKDAKGDTMGFGVLGIQAIPNNLKVGDKLKPYEDVGVTLPDTKEYTAKHDILKGYQTSVSSYRDFGYVPGHGFGPNITTVRETKAIYDAVDVKVRETTKFSSKSINYAVAEVMAEEEATVDGTKYKAFRIESQSWIKGEIKKTYDSDNSEWKQAREQQDENTKQAMAARGIKKGYLNKQGYTVSYRTEWFVPGMGVVKMLIYDNFGNIIASSQLESIK